ncbi:acyl- thioesterase ii [Vairimorpha ceranae]|uniref:Acyl-thioesterase ii n=1 Tax=Vairimorpha ceranae TaxID=40302 RepID=A0A0F9ZB40_9MICR|nr:acyl- thioesterase ii [Vairimorpha ceranae]KAF5140275.1 hypothetical protein G9O61_00g015310 [Vairimorpha ceranae]KKO74934.1 acyl- thioesterase ii [Vairimorpha ceranae]
MDFLNLKKLDNNTYEGTELWSPFPGYPIFGGQLAAQSLCAGLFTVNLQSSPNFVHSIFLNPGDPSCPVEYTVQNIKDGKTLQMRNILGKQNGKFLVQTTICCTLGDSKDRDYKNIQIIEKDVFVPINDYILHNLSKSNYDTELINKQYNLLVENLGVLNHSFEIKIGRFRNNKRQIKINILKNNISKRDFYLFMTLVSDLLIVESALLSLNMNIFSKELHKISSVDHNLYFVTSKVPKDKIIYYILECINIHESKANIEGKMCTEDGTLICITSQQALVRFKK